MTHDSSFTISESDVKMKTLKSPRTSTLNMVRQFARTYVNLSGTQFNQLVIN